MNSEKIKEIKEKLQEEIFIANSFGDKLRKVPTKELENLLTLINELESENEMLSSRYRNLEINYNDTWEHYREYEVENQQLKYRIAELEKENRQLSKAINSVQKGFDNGEFISKDCQTRTLKQFVVKAKERCHNYYPSIDHYCCSEKAVSVKDIDELLKEYENEKGNN